MKHIWSILIGFLLIFSSVSPLYACIDWPLPEPWYTTNPVIDISSFPLGIKFLDQNPYIDKNFHPYIFKNDTNIPLYLIVSPNQSVPKNSRELPQGIIPLYKLIDNQVFFNTGNLSTWKDVTNSGVYSDGKDTYFHKSSDGKVYLGIGSGTLEELGINLGNVYAKNRPSIIPPRDPQKFNFTVMYGDKPYKVQGTIFYTPYYPPSKGIKEYIPLFIIIILFLVWMLIFYWLIKLIRNYKNPSVRRKFIIRVVLGIFVLFILYLCAYSMQTLSFC